MVDSGTERKIVNTVKELKPTAKDKIVFMVLGNSFLLSDDKDENLSLKGAFLRKHLANPEGLQQEDLTSLVCKVARTVTSLKQKCPGDILVLGPMPWYVECCDKHINLTVDGTPMVLNEIERVDAAISGVLPETPGVKIRSVLPAMIGLTPAMYLGEDKIHLSDAGLKALCSYIINILDEEQQGGEAEGRRRRGGKEGVRRAEERKRTEEGERGQQISKSRSGLKILYEHVFNIFNECIKYML